MLETKLILEGIGAEIVERLKSDIQNKSLVTGYSPPNASSKLVNLLRYEATDTNLKVYALDYMYYLEFGRKPGKRPPRGVIRKWIDDKGITPDPSPTGKQISKDSLAFLIQRAIGEKGTLIYQHGGSHLLSSIISQQFISDMRDKLIFSITNEIRSSILKLAA